MRRMMVLALAVLTLLASVTSTGCAGGSFEDTETREGKIYLHSQSCITLESGNYGDRSVELRFPWGYGVEDGKLYGPVADGKRSKITNHKGEVKVTGSVETMDGPTCNFPKKKGKKQTGKLMRVTSIKAG